MRLTVTAGGREVHIKLKGHSRKVLAAAEAAALRLLAAPEPPAAEDQQPFGYSVVSDHEQAYHDPGGHYAE